MTTIITNQSKEATHFKICRMGEVPNAHDLPWIQAYIAFGPELFKDIYSLSEDMHLEGLGFSPAPWGRPRTAVMSPACLSTLWLRIIMSTKYA